MDDKDLHSISQELIKLVRDKKLSSEKGAKVSDEVVIKQIIEFIDKRLKIDN